MSNRSRIVLKSAAVAAAAMLTVAFWGSSASAHDTVARHGSLTGDWAKVFGDHYTIIVHDGECDNHGVYADFTTDRGNAYVVEDPDGCGGDVGERRSPDGSRIHFYRVCERSVGCSGHVYT